MSKNEAPVYLNTEAIRHNKAGLEALGIVMDLLLLIWTPAMQPFRYDEEDLAKRLHKALPARGYSAEKLREQRPGVATFFTELPDGRWAPSPEYFSMTDGNLGRQMT